MKALLMAAGATLALPFCCFAQQPAATSPAPSAVPIVTVQFSNPQLSPSQWTLTLHPDGRGHFSSKMGSSLGGQSPDEMRTPDVNRDVQLSPRFAAGVFETAQRQHWFNENCESRMKVAFQGWKTLSYSGPDGRGSCTFNYSQDKEVQSLGDSFLAVTDTILEGVRLEMLLQHDPLGLDQEMQSLAAAAQDGRAQQIYVIKDILQRLARDDKVMEMVRKQARSLLARAQT